MLLFLASFAHAGGYYFADVGVRSFSRGGAFIAGADDLTAMYYNPAALIRVDTGQVTLNLAGVDQAIWFDRLDYEGEAADGSDLITDPIINAAPAYVIPHLEVAHTFGLKDTTFAFGFNPPYAPDLSYPADGPQRYSLIDTVIIQTITGPSVAHQINPWLSVGLGASWNVLYVQQELKVTLSTNLDQELENRDVGFEVQATDLGSLGFNGGLLIEPPEGKWAVGAMVIPPIKFDAEGEMVANFAGNFYYEDLPVLLNEISKDEDITVKVTMPLIVKTGALVRPTEAIEIEAAFVWEGWSSLDDLVVTDLDMLLETQENSFGIEDVVITDDVVLPLGYINVWSVRLGGQVDIGDRGVVRLGGLYETSAIPDESLSPAGVDSNKVGLGFGGTFGITDNLELDAGVFRGFYQRREIRNSEVTQIAVDPLTGDVVDGRVIGDGDYEASLLIAGGGLNWRFGGS